MADPQRLSVRRFADRPSIAPIREDTVVRRRSDDREDDGFLQHMAAARALQTKLAVGAPDDPFEREAERMADVLTGRDLAGSTNSRTQKGEVTGPITPHVQRALGKGEPSKKKEEERTQVVQKVATGPGPAVVPAEVERWIDAMKTDTGAPLSPWLRQRFEAQFGFDFSGVRVHTGERAADAARALRARAFTIGDHIFFGSGEYQPDTSRGQHLMAHELTHVVQQNGDQNRVSRRRQIIAFPIAGKTFFKSLAGEFVELPEDMTLEQVAKMEEDALAAEARLKRELPEPKPVPDVRKPAPKPVKAEAPKRRPRGKRVAGKPREKLADVAEALLKAVGGGTAAQYLVTKGAPVFVKGAAKLAVLKRNQQKHEDGDEKLKRSEDAVVIPPTEEQAVGNSGQVGTVGDRPVPVVDVAKGTRTLSDSLAANVPASIGELDNFQRDKRAQHTGAEVLQVVQGDKNSVVGTFGDVRLTPPPVPSGHDPQDLPPPEPAPPTAAMHLGRGAIAPLLKEHTDVSQYTREADARLKEEGITQEQLDMVDSGDLAEANKEKKALSTRAATEPIAVQKMALEERTRVDKELGEEEQTERSALASQRKSALAATGHKQKGTKTALEKKRDDVAKEINNKYQVVQDAVAKRLADLEVQSMKRFDEGNRKAAQAFETDVNRELKEYKADRYSGWFGWARKAKDWLLGLDDLPRVKEIFVTNRAVFEKRITKLVEDITADNQKVIQECRDALTAARTKIDEYVAGLEPGLRDIGKKAAQEMGEKLDDLDRTIGKKEEELRNKLKDKQTGAIRAIDQKIEKMKEEMSGALAKVGRLLLWAAKKFFTWALGKFGFSLSTIENIINKGTAVLKAIFTGPIRFVKNLIGAAKMGFINFGKNFLDHLKDALFEWLTGALGGITLPAVWNLKGIVSVLFQVVGVTWSAIKARLLRLVPAPIAEHLETTFALVKTIIVDGPMAAWEQLKDIAESLRKGFVDAITDWVKRKVVEEAVKTILAVFVPGAGIIRAIIAIYDTIVFFIQKARDILSMIGNFLGSIAEIAAGNIAGAAKALEDGLARGLKLVIAFLAKFLRLDGITARIRTALETVRDKVTAALDKVAEWIVNMAKKAGKVLLGAKEKGAEQASPDQPGDERWNAAVAGVTSDFEQMKSSGVNAEELGAAIPIWKTKYGFKSLEVVDLEDGWEIVGEMSPKRKVVTEEIKEITFERRGTSLGQARYVRAVPVHRTEYSAPSEDPVGWERLDHAYWIRGHLLHGRSGGPGLNWNMVPIPKKVNSAMWSDHEKDLYTLVGKKPRPLVWVEIDVGYWGSSGSAIRDPEHFGKTITVKYGEADRTKSGHKFGKELKSESYDVPLPTKASDLMPPKY